MKRILIVGAGGQIGSELTVYLRNIYGGSNVVATDMRECKTLGETGPFEVLNALDATAMASVVARYHVDTIFNLVALLSAVGERNPQMAWSVNMGALNNSLEVARQHHCALFTPSSIGAFGPTSPKDKTPQDTIMQPTTIYGVNTDYLEIRRYRIADGDTFSEQDIRTAAKVCLVGQTVVDELFPDGTNPVGRVIRFGTIPLRIVGVLESKGYNSMGMDQDDLILAPYTTVQKRILAITHLQEIVCSALSEAYTEEAIDEISAILRTNHKLKEGDEEDFTIRSQQELSSMLTSTTDMMTMLLAAVAGISLLVGGIGIMNIMYVSVTERTREIGLRMSIGAKGRDILAQFLIESILISVTGGLIGVLLGIGAAVVVKVVASFPIYIQPWSVFLSFAVCTLTGVFFGWYPAQKAAMLDPIEAIRYE